MSPTITVRHNEEAVEMQAMCSPVSTRIGLDVDASITYGVGQHMEALAAVDRLAESLRRQIADARVVSFLSRTEHETVGE